MTRHSADTSVLGPTTHLVGRVGGHGALRIEGSVRGDIDITGDAEVAEGATIEGNVHASSLDISGSLLGDVVAKGPVAIRSGAIVRGELRGTEVSIEPGSRVSIRLDTPFELDFGRHKRR